MIVFEDSFCSQYEGNPLCHPCHELDYNTKWAGHLPVQGQAPD